MLYEVITQSVGFQGRAHDGSTVFPEFLHALNEGQLAGRSYRVVDLLGQIPSIHRTRTAWWLAPSGRTDSMSGSYNFV